MKNTLITVAVCMLAGCASTKAKHSQWITSIATDKHAGQVEYLDLSGLLLEWSTASKGKGWLYFSRPETNDRVWTFPGRVATGEHKTGVKVYDGDIVNAVHHSGRKFKIKIVIQTEYYAKVKYREI